MTAETICRKSWARAGLLLLTLGLFTACEEQPASDAAAAADSATATGAANVSPSPSPALTPERMAQWSRNCALCHIRGEGGAPVLGDHAAWAARLERGEDALLESTIAGLNNMPPLGYCMDCEAEDFLALIRFMGGER